MDKNIATFLREDTKTVGVNFIQESFEKNKDGYSAKSLLGDGEYRLSQKEYTYVTDLDLEPGDLVVVFAQGVPKVVLVASVHEELAIQPNEDIEYKWIVCKIDMEAYKKNLFMNGEITRTVGSSYKKNIRRQFQAMLMTEIDSDSKDKLLSLIGHKNV
jgi:hypothetical protein